MVCLREVVLMWEDSGYRGQSCFLGRFKLYTNRKFKLDTNKKVRMQGSFLSALNSEYGQKPQTPDAVTSTQ